MTNPAAAIKMLITYAMVIPLAIVVGYMLTNPLDYGTLGFFGLVALLLISPIIIKWHYPLMIFALSSPIYCFFLKGDPPLMQVAVILSLGVSIIERTVNSDKRFISVPIMTWPLMFTVAMVVITAELTGGIGLKALGGPVSGGKKYVELFIGLASFFAITSRVIPKHQRNLYVAFFFLSGVLQFVSDLFPFLPSPLNYINLLIPPSGMAANADGVTFGLTRLGSFAASAGVVANFMLAKYGLTGIFRADRPLRFLSFFLLMVLTFLGGFRIVLVAYLMMGFWLFFFEGLYRTRLSLVLVMGAVLGAALLVPFAQKLPFTFQRALTVLPFLKLDPLAVADAEGSKKWREEIWADTWPKVPQYLLLGKGFALTAQDFTMMGSEVFANDFNAKMDRSESALAISSDFHNGPLSTLIPFGIWGAISFLWVSLTMLYILNRNYRYGDPELKTVNTFLLVLGIQGIFGFYFIFGSYFNDVGAYARLAGFSIALNWGICAAKRQPVPALRIKPLPRPQPLPA
jgi:hypothetical protein